MYFHVELGQCCSFIFKLHFFGGQLCTYGFEDYVIEITFAIYFRLFRAIKIPYCLDGATFPYLRALSWWGVTFLITF
jgi:hypothetical protein